MYYYFENYSSLIKNIESKYKNVTIHYNDISSKLVLFSEGSDKGSNRQFILTRYKQFGNFYYNINDDSTGTSFGPGTYVMVASEDSIGHLIWGVSNVNKEAASIEIEFLNIKNRDSYKLNLAVKDGSFLGCINEKNKKINLLDNSWKYNIRVFDEDEKVIYNQSDLKVAGQFLSDK
jgi:hypothetical protein